MILLLFGGTDFSQNSQLDSLVAYAVLFSETVSLCSPAWIRTHESPVSASQMIKLLLNRPTTIEVSVRDYCVPTL